ncbi:MAG: SPASM domain-containing protein, partial [Nitrospirae bacterium]|nr:SPASM domain-containing protein [Nitrospirota bacterium]
QEIAKLLRNLGIKRYYLIHMDLLSKDLSIRKEALAYQEFIHFHDAVRQANSDMGIFRVHASCFDKKKLPAGVRCAGGVRKLSVMPDGSVFPCNLLQGFVEFNVGNIFNDSFADIWNSAQLDLFRRYDRNRCSSEECLNKQMCTGGCPAHGYYHCGNPEGMDIRCGL